MKEFDVSFKVSTKDEEITEADIQAEMERLEFSTMLNIKNVKVKKQDPYWMKAKCPKCKTVNKIKPTKDNVVDSSIDRGRAAVKLKVKCEKCGNVFYWAEQINPLRIP